MNFEKFLSLERKIEKDLDIELKNLLDLEQNGSGTYKPQVFFVMPSKSSRGLQHAPRSSKFKALTVLVLYKDDNTIPRYLYSVCDNEDHFSRVVGRTTVKEKAIKILKSSSLSSLPFADNTLNQGSVVTDYFRKITNKIFNEEVIKHNACNEIQKESKLDNLESSASIIARLNNLGLTVKFKHFNFSNQNPFPIVPPKYKGGITLVSVTNTNANVTTTSAAICVESDNFNKETGRQISLLNFLEHKSEMMMEKVKQKFGSHPDVKEFLISKGL